MTYAALALCFSVVAFTLAAAVAAGASVLLHATLGSRIARLTARRRAGAYLSLRLAPTAAGLLFAGLFFLPAFLLFEPHDSGEQITLTVLAFTLLAALPLLRCARGAAAASHATRIRAAGWLADAQPLEPRDTLSLPAYVVNAPFPVVAVVGVRRPYVVVSRTVLDACDDGELAAILAHEATHVSHRDNLKRLLMLCTPDLLTGTAAARDLELKWQQASEEIADDGAGSIRSLDLAAALVKVARLTQGQPALPATMTAFCRGDDIARRIKRLTGARPRRATQIDRGRWFGGLLAASLVTVALAAATLPMVHAVTEVIVTLLQ